MPGEPPGSLQVGPQVAFRAGTGRFGKLKAQCGRQRERDGEGGRNWGEGGEVEEREGAGGAQRKTSGPS